MDSDGFGGGRGRVRLISVQKLELSHADIIDIAGHARGMGEAESGSGGSAASAPRQSASARPSRETTEVGKR